MKFELGEIVITPGALEVIDRLGADTTGRLLARHHACDWGDLDDADKAHNDQALKRGHRLLSVYGQDGDRLYVLTEQDRTVTTILTPMEY